MAFRSVPRSVVISLAILSLHLTLGSSDEGIHLRSGTLRGPADRAGLPDGLLTSRTSLSRGGPALIKLRETITPSTRRLLASKGAHLAAPLGPRAFVAWLEEAALPGLESLTAVAWIAPYHPGLRVAPEIAAIGPEDARPVVPVSLELLPGSDTRAVARRLERWGITPRGMTPQGNDGRTLGGRIVITPTPARLAALRERIAAWPEILWIGRRSRYLLLNDGSAWVGQSGLSAGETTPIHAAGLLGEGQIVGVFDTGVDADMCFFRDDALGRPPAHAGLGPGTPDPGQRKVLIVDFLWNQDDPASPGDWDDHGHGSHVAGSVAGDDLAQPGLRDHGDGMAPAAKLVIQDGGFSTDDCADMPAIGCPAADLHPYFLQAFEQGVRIHTNSWGDRENFSPQNIYSDGSEDADDFMWQHPEFLLLFAAGNSGPGPDTIGSPATAKNVLAVGATAHAGAAGSVASFSSRGKTADGRIKPDVTVPGSGVISADSDGDIQTGNCGTVSMSGTSMASPTAAGLAALVREYFVKGFYPSGAKDPADALTPSAALLKATLIASATPMKNLDAPPPTGDQGWGRILLDDALYLAGDPLRLLAIDASDRFAGPGQEPDEQTLEVLDGSRPLKVVLVWTDYPSTPAAALNLVNDLDLQVEAPDGTLYLGNSFSAGYSFPNGAADRLNNVEVVKIQAPMAGTWKLRVLPEAIPQPDQGYALVATGRFPAEGVVLERTSLGTRDDVGGNGDGVLEPGEWIDLPLTLLNSGSADALNVGARVESLSPTVEVVTPETLFPDLSSGEQSLSLPPHLRIRLRLDHPCTEPVLLRLTYHADGYSRGEEVKLPTGRRAILERDDFEGTSAWRPIPEESTAGTGQWLIGDPVGTGYQPEDDASSDPGRLCLYTAPNDGGSEGQDDVDGGAVVARSGEIDLSGHPEARVSLSRWFANRDPGEDDGDFFRLEIRPDGASPDVPLERLGTSDSAPRWTEVVFRVGDFVTPGPQTSLRATAADGTAAGSIIEAAIDEVSYWDPECETHDPPPRPVDDLRVSRAGEEIQLHWFRPPIDPAHGLANRYSVHRSSRPDGGFIPQDEIFDGSKDLSWPDPGAGGTLPAFYAYEVIAANEAGTGDALP